MIVKTFKADVELLERGESVVGYDFDGEKVTFADGWPVTVTDVWEDDFGRGYGVEINGRPYFVPVGAMIIHVLEVLHEETQNS